MAHLRIRGVRSYAPDREICFDLSSKVTLIYGQNGSGKSTVSGYFYDSQADKYRHCAFESPHISHFQVFNQEYIDNKFARSDYQPGIFTLSEANQESQDKINSNNKERAKLSTRIDKLNEEIAEKEGMKETVIDHCTRDIFNRTVNDRKILSDFLDGAKIKRSFYERMVAIPLSDVRTTTEELADKWRMLNQSEGTLVAEIHIPQTTALTEDTQKLMQEPVMPASSTQFSALIQKIGNADWVRQGQHYINDDICPFCQQPFDVITFSRELTQMFDETYQTSLGMLSQAAERLAEDCDNLAEFERRVAIHTFVDDGSQILSLVKAVNKCFQILLQQLLNKIKEPSLKIQPENIQEPLLLLQNEVDAFNTRVRENNRLAENFTQEKQTLYADVMAHLRRICDEFFTERDRQLGELQNEVNSRLREAESLAANKKQLDDETNALTRQLSDIQPTIDIINANLRLLGITGFEIICHDAEMKLYRLRRGSEPEKAEVFKSLSEGEKTIVSFLYFIESCSGSLTPETVNPENKLIVIDDPISSLSHNYIYEVAALIKRKIIKAGAARHVVILTHNMFFFQEILLNSGRLQDNREAPVNWSLLRIVKSDYSSCEKLSMHEMLNEYQALWQTLKDVRDEKTQPVVLFNTMRNILEYYFSFSCKNEKLKDALESLASEHSDAGEYDSFYRAINRHSHSDGRNILSTGAIDKERYLKMFRRVFIQTDDDEHYLAMMGESEEQRETGV
ncbi:TPA: AAA family ATPase [Salmonella enterica]|uniref:AAA family ATPase n=2 Tax=Enterobacteriaceae TaxID=543 RepID=A0A6L5EI85_9ENTR|nr:MULTISPECIES: AAA family ATPase [Enterobacterales]EFT6763499.1 AAA family ATPase [Salmonella enterica]ELN9503298.1 AAA family ATPase [Citrobacter amalonaticus]MBJ4602746.1 AAA family ATPase [Salmonella enterica subsp. enterica serovar Typhimurium]MBJ4636448.1 AAA family ATPase [Salmonella enterica subsp. enterica serovar London]MCL9317932.1 AAA family ATPase [Salmonella enterica subsp. enterica serovar Enteritidis]MDF8315703.1 AAA family ATPase [Serratia nevei]